MRPRSEPFPGESWPLESTIDVLASARCGSAIVSSPSMAGTSGIARTVMRSTSSVSGFPDSR
jgi:hypothetical protein